MSQRETNMVWLKDTIDQLSCSQQQLQWTEDLEAANVILDNMIRDLERSRRLCESMKKRSALQYV